MLGDCNGDWTGVSTFVRIGANIGGSRGVEARPFLSIGSPSGVSSTASLVGVVSSVSSSRSATDAVGVDDRIISRRSRPVNTDPVREEDRDELVLVAD